MNDEISFQSYTLPPADLLKILILQRRDLIIESFLVYDKVINRDHGGNVYMIKSALNALYRELKVGIMGDIGKNDERKKDFEKLKEKIKSTNYDDLEEAFFQLDQYLYYKGLIKFDNLKNYGTNIHLRNSGAGWS